MTASPVCFPFVGDSVGGSQISAAMLIGALDRRRYNPVVVVHGPGPLTDYLNDRGIATTQLSVPGYVESGRQVLYNFPRVWRTATLLRRFIAQNDIRLVHCQDGRMNQTWALPARRAGSKFVWHQRSMYAPSRTTHMAMGLADVIATNSNFVIGGLPKEMRGNAVAVDNPFDTETAPPDKYAARADCLFALGLSDNAKLIAFVGNLTAQKRPEVFLRAAADIAAGSNDSTHFMLFGRDRENLEPELTEKAALIGLADRFHFMGFKNPITPWIAGSDLLLAPEVDDAFGRTLVEAMLCRTPVIASDSGGHPEIIVDGETGRLTPPDDAATMARVALSVLCDRDTTAGMADRAYESTRRRYAIQSHADAMMAIYERVLVPNER